MEGCHGPLRLVPEDRTESQVGRSHRGKLLDIAIRLARKKSSLSTLLAIPTASYSQWVPQTYHSMVAGLPTDKTTMRLFTDSESDRSLRYGRSADAVDCVLI